MFERPQLSVTNGSARIEVAIDQADKLIADLREQGFEAERTIGEFNTENLNTGVKQEIVVIQLADGTDLVPLRKFLRGWSK